MTIQTTSKSWQTTLRGQRTSLFAGLIAAVCLVAPMPAAANVNFSTIDADDDGELSMRELVAIFGTQRAQQFVRMHDRDDDDAVSIRELRADARDDRDDDDNDDRRDRDDRDDRDDRRDREDRDDRDDRRDRDDRDDRRDKDDRDDNDDD